MPVLRNQRQELFAQALAQGKTADAAYENAGYRRNRHNASRLKTNETVVARVLELQANQQERFVLTRQYTIEALVENTEKALGRHPVKIGADGNEEFVYRGDVANRALQMLGAELQMFIPKSEVTHKKHDDLDRLSDLELVELLANEAQQLLLEHKSRGGNDGNGGLDGVFGQSARGHRSCPRPRTCVRKPRRAGTSSAAGRR